MARILQSSPLTGASGRIGNLVTYNLRGTQVVRTLPETIKKRKASPLQQQHLSSFKAQHAIAKSVKDSLIDRIWSHVLYQGGENPYNQFIKRNRAAFGGDCRIIFPELMVVSDGNLWPAAEFDVKKEGECLSFTWNIGKKSKFSSPGDRLNIVILAFKSDLNIMPIEAKRADGKASINLPNGSASSTEGYAFWSSEDEENFSPSMYWICR